VSDEPDRAEIAAGIRAKAAELAERSPAPEQMQGETRDRVVYILHLPGGQTYIGQPRAAGPEPEAGQ